MIIGVVGPLCVGKDSLSAILRERGFKMFSFGDILREEMRKKGIIIDRSSMQSFGNSLREEEGADAISRRILARIDNDIGNYLVQGFRNPAEVAAFLERDDFILIALDAPQQTRFQRMKARRREKDPQTFAEFQKIDDMELLAVGQDESGFDIGACMRLADAKIVNDGSLDDLRRKVAVLFDNDFNLLGK